jgi:hypothetical protein
VHDIDLRILLYDIYIEIDVFPASVESDIKENSSEERKSICICIFNTISTSSESTNLKVQPIEMVKSGVLIEKRDAECVANSASLPFY